MGTEAVISLRVKDIVSECVGVGSGPVGGGGLGGARRPWGSVIFPCSVGPSYRCRRSVGGKVVGAHH